MKTLNKTMFKSLLALLCALPLTVSCFDDSQIWDAINDLDARVDSLQNNLDVQIKTVSDMLSGKGAMVITSCVMNPDGSSVVTLANGKSFTLLPQNASVSSLVSVMEVKGVKCWALIGENGELTPITDKNGNAVPVSVSVDVKVKDGKYVLVVNGNEYETGYDTEDLVQVFKSCTYHKDASDQVYALTFDFGDGVKVTIAVDGYKGVIFKLSNLNSTVVSEYFIDYGTTQTFLMETQGVVDYIMQIPDGWRVEEKVEEVSGDLYVSITAPKKETVTMGAAVASGELKVVSVVEGGKAAVTKLSLSTDPFKTYSVSALNAVVKPYNGVQKFVYGFMLSSDFELDQVLANITATLTSSTDLPQGYFMSEEGIEKTYTEMYPELVEGGDYVFWVVPVLFDEGDAETDGHFYIKEDMFRTFYLVPVSLEMEVGNETVLDANLKIEARGIKSIYAGLTEKSANAIEELLYQLNNGVYEPIDAETLLPYDGPASEFPEKDYPTYMEPATSYIAWVVIAEEGKTEFAATDVVYKEFTTKEIVSGGTLAVTTGTAVVESSSISHSVSCSDAAMIYYAYLDNSIGERWSGESTSNDTKWNQILKAADYQAVRGSSVEAVVDGLLPETKMWLYVAAVGHDGKYGTVSCLPATTKGVAFNNLTVNIETVEVAAKEATFKVTADGQATGFIYWVGRKSEDFWVSKNFCNSSVDQAAKYLAANPDADAVVAAMKKHGAIAADGTLMLKDLDLSKEYVLIVLAQDQSGNYSQCSSQNGYKSFQTQAIDFGEDFTAAGTVKWHEMKNWIEANITWHKNTFQAAKGQGQGFASYSFSIKLPTDLTGYITCFSTEAEYNGGSLADIMLEIEEGCSKKTSVGRYVVDPETGDTPRHPDWYDDNGKLIQGSQVNVYSLYSHGNPSNGMVTYFAVGAHGETHCSSWENGKCSNYEEQMESINKMMSYDYWREYIIDFGNYAYQGDPNHEYSRNLKDEKKIDEIAKQYVEIYTRYYEGVTPYIYVNEGQALEITNKQATGLDDAGNVMDKVTVMLKDANGNYFEPMYIQVPNYFK